MEGESLERKRKIENETKRKEIEAKIGRRKKEIWKEKEEREEE